jgi:hypothetical protein
VGLREIYLIYFLNKFKTKLRYHISARNNACGSGHDKGSLADLSHEGIVKYFQLLDFSNTNPSRQTSAFLDTFKIQCV